MRHARFVFSFFLSALFLFPCAAQQPTAPPPQAPALLQRAYAALSGGQILTDVTLSGTARRITASDDDTGTAVLKAMADGHSLVNLSLSLGTRSESRTFDSTGPSGAWSDPNGIQHPIANHNLYTDPAWFFPAFTVARLVSSSATVATYIGQETLNGQSVLHLSVSQRPTVSAGRTVVLLQQLSQMDLFLDPATYLPVALTFNTHPDNDANLGISIQVQFSDYRIVNGAQIPFHIQKFLNNGLILDFQASSATLSTGLSVNEFTIQ